MVNVKHEIAQLIEDNHEYYDKVVREKVQNCENFEDITDGVLYNKLVNSLPKNDKLNFATCTFNTDGSPVFKSSKCSIWPIQLIINELPFSVRASKPLITGIWFGRDKPIMNIFLKPFVDYMNTLSRSGVTCTIANERRRIKIFTLCCCVDSVARAPVQGFIQFNGYFGCGWCLHPGNYVASNRGGNSNRGGSVKYTLQNETPAKRTEIQTLVYMQRSQTSRKPIYGVKNSSVLINMERFNIISAFVPDYMHCVCLGIAEQFLDLWLSSNRPYSLSVPEIDKINDIMLEITVPNKIQ